jgi:hypothetical protein
MEAARIFDNPREREAENHLLVIIHAREEPEGLRRLGAQQFRNQVL